MSAERLSRLQAAYVVARRDFVAILFSRSFLFFLLGPLFPLIVGMLAGGIGQRVESEAAAPQIGIAMQAGDVDAMLEARASLVRQLGSGLPEMVALERLQDGAPFDAHAVLERREGRLAAVITGTPTSPVLTGTSERLNAWRGPVALIAANAAQAAPTQFPDVTTQLVAASGASDSRGRLRTAQAGQLVLFLLIMLLAGMVLSNLVEEKGNKIIEILAAAIPMDAVFMGKLFAMLAISLVGIALWGTVIGSLAAFSQIHGTLPAALDFSGLPTPGVGWPLFLILCVLYFGMGYLLLGSIYLTVGSLAATVREVQTLAMPVTMLQILLFFFASLALTAPGEPIEWAAIVFPLTSPFAMVARAAQFGEIWPHALALGWQALCVVAFVRFGSGLFRRKAMKSGPQGVKGNRGLGALLRSAFRKGSAPAA